ncbi:hypothetical protein ACTNEO_12420 [Gracilibacillus sp. HCP3S3_G5_1]|uniref:hypothetical protein n=1 Tax=unclassified Gracilibacillus TaxID=2625209 RepID=UPI003F8C522A
MKKFMMLFAVCFIFAVFVLQILSGMLLTMFFSPNIIWEEISSLLSYIEITRSNVTSSLLTSFIAFWIAFGATKLISKNPTSCNGTP